MTDQQTIRGTRIPKTRRWLTERHSGCQAYLMSSDDIQALTADESRAYIVWCLFDHSRSFRGTA